jgi:putative hydrolase of the HAD superfamily
MIKLLIFDVGGVIIDYSEDDYIRYISDKFGLDFKKLAMALNPLVKEMDYGWTKVSYVESKLSRMFNIPKLDLEWISAYKKLSKLDTKVANFVLKLSRRYRTVMMSNISITRYLESKQLFLYKFKRCRTFASCYLHMRKPERRMYLYVLEKMNVKPEEALFIDNMQENVDGARKAGIKSIRFTSYAQLVRALKKYGVSA